MTLYPDWTPPKYPAWLEKMARGPVRSAFTNRWHYNSRKVQQADADGLENLVPIIIATEREPAELRREMGGAVWKKIHHATQATNGKRAEIWLQSLGKVPWSEIVQIRPLNLRHVRQYVYANEAWPVLRYAGERAGRGEFYQVTMLYRDTVRMGVPVNPEWSLKRLKKEHDAAALKAALEKADPTPWAEAWVNSFDGYKFERLISDQDMAYEGICQRHCIASYKNRARNGSVVVFRVTGKDRATFAFGTRLVNQQSQWQELKTFANGSPSKELRRASSSALSAFILELCF